MPMTAANTEPIQTGGVSGAAMLTRKPKPKKKVADDKPLPPDQQHWSQQPTGAAILSRRKK